MTFIGTTTTTFLLLAFSISVFQGPVFVSCVPIPDTDVREFEKATVLLPDVEVEEELVETADDASQHPVADAPAVAHEVHTQATSDPAKVENNEVLPDKGESHAGEGDIKFDAESQSRGGAVKAEGGGGLLSGLQSGVSSLVPSGAPSLPSVPSVPGISSIPGLGGGQQQEGAGSISRPELILGSFQVARMPMPSPAEMLSMMQTFLPAMQAALPGLQGALPAMQSIPNLIGGGATAAG